MAISAQDITKIRIKPLPLGAPFGLLLGDVPLEYQWTMGVFGGSFSGKSSFALLLADELSRHGNVLYGNMEENYDTGTIQNKMKVLNLRLRNVSFLEKSSVAHMEQELQTGKYKYCIIDSISEYATSLREIKEALDIKKRYPNISFIFILHGNKQEGNYIGPSKIKHLVDIMLECRKGTVSTTKNRLKSNIRYMNYQFFQKKFVEE